MSQPLGVERPIDESPGRLQRSPIDDSGMGEVVADQLEPRGGAEAFKLTSCSFGLSATSQQYFSLRTN
jgi:hypothetical protein